MQDAYWSRRIARAFSETNPDLDMRKRVVDTYCGATSGRDIPQWVKDWVDEALAEIET